MRLAPLVIVSLGLAAIAEGDAFSLCATPVDCITHSRDEVTKTKCNTSNYNLNPLSLNPTFFGIGQSETTECTEVVKRAGSESSNGKKVGAGGCGTATTYTIKVFTKGENLPLAPIDRDFEFTLPSGSKISLHVEANEFCNVYYPLIDPDSATPAHGCGGGNGVLDSCNL